MDEKYVLYFNKQELKVLPVKYDESFVIRNMESVYTESGMIKIFNSLAEAVGFINTKFKPMYIPEEKLKEGERPPWEKMMKTKKQILKG